MWSVNIFILIFWGNILQLMSVKMSSRDLFIYIKGESSESIYIYIIYILVVDSGWVQGVLAILPEYSKT